MEYIYLLGLFLAKHAFLSHVTDAGYSDARDVHHPQWYVGLIFHCLIEVVVSILILVAFSQPLYLMAITLGLESSVLVASALVERRAPLFRVLQYHVYSEASVAMCYVLLMVLIWYDPASP